jgi:hypothetical protein
MWSFAVHTPQTINIPISAMASVRSGLEARYASRFSKVSGTSSSSLKHTDDARKLVDEFRTSSDVIATQEQNIKELFYTAETMLKTIEDFQMKTGEKQVNNIPLPGPSIQNSYGKKLGFIKLVMQFCNAGMLHFMEQTLELKDDIDNKDSLLRAIAGEYRETRVLGSIQTVEIEDLSKDDPIVITKNQLPEDDEEDLLKTLEKETVTVSAQPKQIQSITPPGSESGKDVPIRPETPSAVKKVTPVKVGQQKSKITKVSK